MADRDCQLVDALEREWRDALCNKDMDRLRELVHPDFTLIGTRSSGPFVMHRQDWLDAIERREVETIDLQVRDGTAVGDVIFGTVHARWKVKYLGRVIQDCVLLTDVWVKEDGQWRAIRRHSTPSPEMCPET